AAFTAYYFRVRAYNAQGNSDYSNVARDTTTPAGELPNPATDLTLTPNGDALELNWSWDDNGGCNFSLQRRDGESGQWIEFDFCPSDERRSDYIPNLQYGHTYYYRAIAYNDFGESGPSNEVAFARSVEAPSILQASVGNEGEVRLSWNDNAGN